MSQPGRPAPATGDSQVAPLLTCSRKRKIEEGIVALAIANCCFVQVWFDLLKFGGHYLRKQPVLRVELVALAINILGLALIIWLGMAACKRFRGGILSLVLNLVFLGLLIIPVEFIRMQLNEVWGVDLSPFLQRPIVRLSFLAVCALVIWKHRQVSRVAAMVVGVTFPMALFNIVKIILLCLNVVDLNECNSSVPLPQVFNLRQGQPRVLWIIFDETDYRLAFEERPAGVKLPEFDRLRKESLFASEAHEPGDGTIISMPALISGRSLLAVEVDGCNLLLTQRGMREKTVWGVLPSVFSQARDIGVNTALVGWLHPYARVLAGSLNYCSWYSYPSFQPARSTTLGGSIQQQVTSLAWRFHARQLFINICKDSLGDADSTVVNPIYGLILLHLPPPHGPFVFLPEKNVLSPVGSSSPDHYFNNLALADHELGELRQSLEISGLKSNTWIILSSDHSWRRSKTYDGRRDYRVPFIVKAPVDEAAITYSRPFNTVLTHDLILSILRGEVTNQPNASTWLDIHGKLQSPADINFETNIQNRLISSHD